LKGGKRIAAHVHESDSNESASEPTTGQHTLTSAQYEQLMSLFSKHNMAVTPNTEEQHSAYLAGKSLCLFTAKPEMSWIIDGGATDHITPHLHLFQSFVLVIRACFITMSNGKSVQVKNIGTVALNGSILLKDVLHVPDFHFNLLSAGKLAKTLSSNVVFTPTCCYLQDHLKNNQLVLGSETGDLHLVTADLRQEAFDSHKIKHVACLSSSELWHYRLGHPSSQHMSHIQGLPNRRTYSICNICP